MTIHKQNRGFTLIELLVVIAIIGLLSSIILASLNTARAKSRDARRLADTKELQTALELYNSDHSGAYIINTAAITTNSGFATAMAALVTGGYMGVIPTDPGTNVYKYLSTSSGAYYCLGVNLEGSSVPASTCNATTLGVAAPASGTGAYNVGP